MSVFEALTDDLRAAPDGTAAFGVFERRVRDYGYISVDYASGPVLRWPMVGNLDWRPDVIHASFDWSEVYFGTDFQKHDVMLPHMLTQSTPWLYWDVWGAPMEDPVARELTRLAQTRVASGLSIPFHGPGLRFAGVNLGSDQSREACERFDRETRADVFLLANLFHTHMRERVGDSTSAVRLSPRERECLTWAAVGKTAWETATILTISESAVKKHLAAASAKLGARTRAHAVAVAVSTGLISP